MEFGDVGSGKLVRAPSLPDEIARKLREEIRKGTLEAGNRLPTEQQLSRMFGVSRPVVREAISQLKFDGLVESFQGRGVFVKEGGDNSAFRLQDPDLSDRRELEDMLEFLVGVEVAATGVAAARRSRRDLARIKKALEDIALAVDKGRSGVNEDLGFHQKIVEATHNPFFITFAAFLENRVRNLIRVARTNTARFEGLVYEVQNEHVAIYEAIERQDTAAAKEAAERHLRNAAARLSLYGRDKRP